MRGVYSNNLELLTSEAKELTEQLQQAVDKDAVEVGSEAWQEMQKDINGVTKKISETNVALAKLYTEQFEYIQNNYQNQISSYESLNDANEKNFKATTNYYTEMRDISRKTLNAQKDELADLEKEFAEAMDSGRIEEGSEAWYKLRGAIDDTKRSISKTRTELKQFYQDELSYIQSNYDNQLSLYAHYSNLYSKKATMIETQGYMASSKLIENQKRVQEKNISVLSEELSSLGLELNQAMNEGKIQKYSEAWYNMTSSINAVKEAIHDARIEQEKLIKAQEQLSWDTFDFQQEMISQPKDENDFFMNLLGNVDLYDKKGALNRAGIATLGLHNNNIDVYLAQRDEYTTAIKKLDKQYKNDKHNNDYIKRRQELIKARRDSILAIESEEQAMISMAENGIKTELDALKELISTYKESIDAAKELYDYQKSVTEKAKDIAKIQKQLSAYANDSSEETKATVQKLQVDFSEAQKSLQETEYDHMITEQKKLLDGVYDEYEAFLNTRLDDSNALLNDLKNIVNTMPDEIKKVLEEVANAIDVPMSETMKNTWETAAKNIEEWNKTHAADQQITKDAVIAGANSWGTYGKELNIKQDNIGLSLETATNNITQGISSTEDKIKSLADDETEIQQSIGEIAAMNDLVDSNLTTANSTLDEIKKYVKNIAEESNKDINTFQIGDVDFDDYVTASDANSIARASIRLDDFDDKQTALADIDGDGYITMIDANEALRISLGLSKNKKTKSFSTGGLADYTGIANIHGTESKPELVLNAQDTQNFIKLNDILREVMKTQSLNLLGDMYGVDSPILQLAKIPSRISGISSPEITQNTTINLGGIQIDHVQDYNDLVNQMGKDPKFEKLINSIQATQLGYGKSVDKYKYRW